MGDVLSILAIAVLLGLVAFSVIKQRRESAQANLQEDTRTSGAEHQRERSMRRRAEARAAANPDR